MDNDMVKASREAYQKRLKLEEQKKDTLKKAVTENKMENEVRKIMSQEQKKEDQSTFKKQAELATKIQLQKESAQREVNQTLMTIKASHCKVLQQNFSYA